MSYCATITRLVRLPTAFCFHDLCHEKALETRDDGNDPRQRYPRVIYLSSVKHLLIYDLM